MFRLEIINETRKSGLTKNQINSYARTLFRKLILSPIGVRRLRQLKTRNVLTLVLVNDLRIQKLNYEFRGMNKPTDILSFAPVEAASLGELVMNIPRLKRDAKVNGLKFKDQFLYIFIHGVLHLLNYDHESNDKAARRMYSLQDKIFEEMCGKWR